MKKLYAFIMLAALTGSAVAQTTFEHVRTLLQANCTVGCHSGVAPSGQLKLDGTLSEVYQELVNANPVNPEANAKGMKLVDPGYPYRSFLFVKLSHNIDATTYLTTPMGNAMPDGQPALDDEEIELVRQWIMYGAGDTNHYFNPQLLTDYYNGPGMPRITPLAPPDPSEGFQVHMGPFFMAPSVETEFFYKYDTRLEETKEVYRVHTQINEASHHTALYKYLPELDSFFLPGLRPVNTILDAAGVYYTSNIIGQWPNSQDLVLPEGTAFTWEQNAVIDFNYHIPNYNADSIQPCEAYMNVYFQDAGTAPDRNDFGTYLFWR
jgi:hypothetical protein